MNPSLIPAVAEVGPFTVRLVDIAYSLLCITIFARVLQSRRFAIMNEYVNLTKSIIPFLVYVGISVALVGNRTPMILSTSLASYTRLLYTFLFGFLLFLSVESYNDLKLLWKSTAVMVAATLSIGVWTAWPHLMVGQFLEARHGGILGIGSFGLVSGLVVVYACIAILRGDRRILSGALMFSVGLCGLLLSRSATSMLAALATIGVYWGVGRAVGGQSRLAQASRVMLALVVAAGVVILLSAVLRPKTVFGLVALDGGSFAHRLMLGYAGVLLFASEPFLGVGWQAGATELFMGDEYLNMHLLRVFGRMPAHYFPGHSVTSVHNMYIQLLSELGIIGSLLFLFGCVGIGVRINRIRKRVDQDREVKLWTEFCAFALIYLLLWWNGNPLYGGQTESLLAVSCLGVLGAVGRLQMVRDGQSQAG